MTYKIYIAEDDRSIAEEVAAELTKWGFECRVARRFSDIVGEFEEYEPQLVLLDIMLPFYNGYHWCEEIRKISNVPIIFISSASDNLNIVMAVNMGADDFIAKPFDMGVLTAKVQALLRRSYNYTESPVLTHRGLSLKTTDNSAVFDGNKIDLTKNEYRILFTLLESKGKTVSREKLMQRLWETDSFVDDNTLTVNINRLRRKLDALGLKDFITTKHGVGYSVGADIIRP
ncbi:MAG: response regulator transcription factor [Oscillospiraceae bacterium]|nr:response regulator transcription factor [Oscillospiraceae bacterium]